MRDPAYAHHLVLSPISLGLVKKNHQQWQTTKQTFPDECMLLRSASEWSIGL